MGSSDVVFARIIIGSVAVLALLALAYFRLLGDRARRAVMRHHTKLFPVVALASVGGLIAPNMPLGARAFFSVVGFGSLFVCLFAVFLTRWSLPTRKPKS